MDGDALLQHQRFLRRIVRELARDPDEAEDLLQATWTRALERPARSDGAPRAWLARIARNLSLNRGRARHNEAHKLAQAAGERAWPSAEEVAERLELAERVLAAVRELEEPLRAVVLARYYEELGVEEIARRSGVPLDTVKERLKRARERLKRRLGRELGEERGLAGFVAVFARWVARIGGGLLVKKGVAVVVVLLVALVAWLRWREPRSTTSTPVTVAASEPSTLAPTSEPTHVAPAERVEAPAPAPLVVATTGSLLVSVIWSDGSPAERVTASVWGDEERKLARFFQAATTDADGLTRIDALAPGVHRVQLERERAFVTAEVRAGEETRVELAVSAGPRLEGQVVDPHGEPVAGAGIWVADWLPSGYGMPLTDGLAALTGADGRFAIPSLGGAREVGARAEGYAPSNDKMVGRSGKPVEEIRLVLPELGGAVAGRVLDVEGEPVAGAIVKVEEVEHFWEYPEEAARKKHLLPIAVFSAPDGSFRLDGIQPGHCDLVVLAPDRLCTMQTVQVVAGSTTWVEVALETGESVSGRVLAADGAPLPDVLVIASNRGRAEPLLEDNPKLSQGWGLKLQTNYRHEFVTTRSDPEGSYLLAGLRPGWTYVAAEAGEAGGAFEPVLLEPGPEEHVNLQISRGLELRGRLVDRSGRALAGLEFFIARVGDNGGSHGARGSFRTDTDGRFAVPNCQDALYSFDIRHARYGRTVARPSARPGPEEQTLVIDYPDATPAFVRGIVVDDHGAPLSFATVDCQNEHQDFYGGSGRSDASGAFLTGELEPGRYRIVVSVEGFPRTKLGIFELSESQTLDLGTVQMKTPGFLSVKVRREDGGPVDDCLSLYLDTANEPGDESAGVELGIARFKPVEPGDYVLRVSGQPFLDPHLTVHIDAGRTTELELLLRIGGYRELRFPGHEDASVISHLHVVVRNTKGSIAFEESVEEAGDGFLTGHAFERGRYTLEASCDDGRRASGAFEVLGRDSLDQPLDFDLR